MFQILNSKRKVLAFTLAETLIVMGIIGVVAALTIPNLTQSTGEKEKVAKLKKIHANLEDAFGRAQAVYGPITEWTGGNSNTSIRLADRLFEFMKITKNCGTTANSGCFTKGDTKGLSGTCAWNFESFGDPKAIFADGSSISMYIVSNSCLEENYQDESLENPYRNICAEVFVDIDGPNKGPYTWGKDIFMFYFTKYGVYPAGGRMSSGNEPASCIGQGLTCAGWVIETGNMDYLKATNGTCPNGTVLNWTNTSCK